MIFNIPVVWMMAGTARVEANTLEEAEKKMLGPDTGLPDGEYITDSIELDKEHHDYGSVAAEGYGVNV